MFTDAFEKYAKHWKAFWIVLLIAIYSLGFLTVNSYFQYFNVSGVILNPLIYLVVGSFALLFLCLNIFFTYYGVKSYPRESKWRIIQYYSIGFLYILSIRFLLTESVSIPTLVFITYLFYAAGAQYYTQAKKAENPYREYLRGRLIVDCLFVLYFVIWLYIDGTFYTIVSFYFISNIIYDFYLRYKKFYHEDVLPLFFIVIVYVVVGVNVFSSEIIIKHGMPVAGIANQRVELQFKDNTANDYATGNLNLIYWDDNVIIVNDAEKTTSIKRDLIKAIIFPQKQPPAPNKRAEGIERVLQEIGSVLYLYWLYAAITVIILVILIGLQWFGVLRRVTWVEARRGPYEVVKLGSLIRYNKNEFRDKLNCVKELKDEESYLCYLYNDVLKDIPDNERQIDVGILLNKPIDESLFESKGLEILKIPARNVMVCEMKGHGMVLLMKILPKLKRMQIHNIEAMGILMQIRKGDNIYEFQYPIESDKLERELPQEDSIV